MVGKVDRAPSGNIQTPDPSTLSPKQKWKLSAKAMMKFPLKKQSKENVAQSIEVEKELSKQGVLALREKQRDLKDMQVRGFQFRWRMMHVQVMLDHDARR